jgi:prevent-host-death family protein
MRDEGWGCSSDHNGLTTRTVKRLPVTLLIGIVDVTISIGAAMIREAPAMTVRQNLGELLNEVQYRNGKILITKAGKPVAALVDIALFERIRKLDEEFEKMTSEFAAAFAGKSEKEVNTLVDKAVKAARHKPTRK